MRTHAIVSFATALLLLIGFGPTSMAQSSAPEHKILVLRMQISGERHQVLEARVVPSSVAFAPPSSNGTLGFLATDAKGDLLLSGGLDDPLIVRAPLPLPGEPTRNHEVIVRTEAQYLLRLPYEPKMKHVYVGKGVTTISSATSQQKLAKITQSPELTIINLDEWLPVR